MDAKPVGVLMSSSHYKSYKHEELEMAFSKTLFFSRNQVFSLENWKL